MPERLKNNDLIIEKIVKNFENSDLTKKEFAEHLLKELNKRQLHYTHIFVSKNKDGSTKYQIVGITHRITDGLRAAIMLNLDHAYFNVLKRDIDNTIWLHNNVESDWK